MRTQYVLTHDGRSVLWFLAESQAGALRRGKREAKRAGIPSGEGRVYLDPHGYGLAPTDEWAAPLVLIGEV